MLTIKLQQTGGLWQADIQQMPGTPPVGSGQTKEQAVAHLFVLLSYSNSAQGMVRKLLMDHQWEIVEDVREGDRDD